MSSCTFVALPLTSVEQMDVQDSNNGEEVRRCFHLAEKSCRRTGIQLVFPVGSCSNMPYVSVFSHMHIYFAHVYVHIHEREHLRNYKYIF